MNRAEKSAGEAHRGLRLVSGGEGAEKAQGHSQRLSVALRAISDMGGGLIWLIV